MGRSKEDIEKNITDHGILPSRLINAVIEAKNSGSTEISVKNPSNRSNLKYSKTYFLLFLLLSHSRNLTIKNNPEGLTDLIVKTRRRPLV